MAANYIQDGLTIQKTVTGTVSSGDPVVVGALFGVWQGDYTSGETGIVAVEGVWQLTKLVSGSFTQGQQVYYRASSAAILAEASGANVLAGVVWEAAASGTTSCNVRINAANNGAVKPL